MGNRFEQNKTFAGRVWFHKPMRTPDEPGMTEEITRRYVYHKFAHDVFNMAENALALHHVREQQIQVHLDSMPPDEDKTLLKRELDHWKGKSGTWQNLADTYGKNIVESDTFLLPEDQGHQK